MCVCVCVCVCVIWKILYFTVSSKLLPRVKINLIHLIQSCSF